MGTAYLVEARVGGNQLFTSRPRTVYHQGVNLAALLSPFVENLSPLQLEQVSKYTEILLRWNARMNLTAIREPENIVIRHFGESFYLSRKLSELGVLRGDGGVGGQSPKVVDIGSGAGLPGIPLKIARPEVALTLVEAQQRKAVFLKEVLRALCLDAEVMNVRAEELARVRQGWADLVALRAVEKFKKILPVSARFVRPRGHLAVLVGSGQIEAAQDLLRDWNFDPPMAIPGSRSRVILLANQPG
jgi:16S rRNA (guanine527-N7)-methyltransferase